MKIYKRGSSYGLEGFIDKTKEQIVNFIEKERDGEHVFVVQDGTTNEELIKILVDRLEFLNDKRSCVENFLAITNLKQANFWLKERIKSKDTVIKNQIV